MNIGDIIIAPVITEKSMKNAALGKFTFKVAISANKPFIKQAVEKQFKVKVLKIFVSLVKGRTGRKGIKREEFVKSAWKKAIVQLEKDQKIALFDVGGQK
ncbi:MAG: 50S ribosomal protein L23 [Candidatus Levybacteria bacterium RIFCSPHIGHO2_02_FULL_37_10]|nr:MAG: 50S ribosomal protein L23 [Candidatus Levybacteria bacterium RIFCSPHIGHO2_02_FULL_37_10]